MRCAVNHHHHPWCDYLKFLIVACAVVVNTTKRPKFKKTVTVFNVPGTDHGETHTNIKRMRLKRKIRSYHQLDMAYCMNSRMLNLFEYGALWILWHIQSSFGGCRLTSYLTRANQYGISITVRIHTIQIMILIRFRSIEVFIPLCDNTCDVKGCAREWFFERVTPLRSSCVSISGDSFVAIFVL